MKKKKEKVEIKTRIIYLDMGEWDKMLPIGIAKILEDEDKIKILKVKLNY